MCTYTCTHAYTNTETNIHREKHSHHRHTYAMHACTHTHTQTHTHTRTRTRTRTNTHTHIPTGSPAKDSLKSGLSCGIQNMVLGGSRPSNINPAVLLNSCELSLRYSRRRLRAYNNMVADSVKSSNEPYKNNAILNDATVYTNVHIHVCICMYTHNTLLYTYRNLFFI